MKNNAAVLSEFGIKNDSKMMMMIQKVELTESQVKIKELNTFISKVEKEVVPLIEKFKEMLLQKQTADQAVPIKDKQLEYLILQVSEMLMMLLLKVDDIHSEDEQVKNKRKETVKFIQSYLDCADQLKQNLAFSK
jgi:hypothetical protein